MGVNKIKRGFKNDVINSIKQHDHWNKNTFRAKLTRHINHRCTWEFSYSINKCFCRDGLDGKIWVGRVFPSRLNLVLSGQRILDLIRRHHITRVYLAWVKKFLFTINWSGYLGLSHDPTQLYVFVYQYNLSTWANVWIFKVIWQLKIFQVIKLTCMRRILLYPKMDFDRVNAKFSDEDQWSRLSKIRIKCLELLG